MKILVTGGTGFIGSALIKKLVEHKHKITIYDNCSNSSNEFVSILSNPDIKFIKKDILDLSSLSEAVKGHDLIIHLAALVDVDESISNPDLTLDVNVKGSLNLLKSCVKENVKNIILISSSAIFGNPTHLPLTENSDTFPMSPYGQSKLEMEKNTKEFSDKYDLNCIILRLFNVYGKGQSKRYAGVITNFLNNILKNQPLTIYGDGTFTRDFIHIDDVVKAILLSIEKIDGKRATCYNIGTGIPISIKQFADTMILLSKKKLDIEFKPAKSGDIPNSCTKIELAQHELGFFPKIQLKTGLMDLIN